MLKRVLSILGVIIMAVFSASCSMDGSDSDVESVSFSDTFTLVEEGATYNLADETSIYPTDADYDVIRWVSYHDSIATVSSEGVVTGIGSGTTDISLSVDGNIATIEVMVVGDGEEAELEIYSSDEGIEYGGLTVWDGNSDVDTAADDDTYDNVISVTESASGSSWGNVVFNDLSADIPTLFDELSFKVRSSDLSEVGLYMMGQSATATFTSSENWNEITVEFTDFSGTTNGDGQLAFTSTGDDVTFYITDVSVIKNAD